MRRVRPFKLAYSHSHSHSHPLECSTDLMRESHGNVASQTDPQ